MARKKYKKDFVDLRGRWVDNERLLMKIVAYSIEGSDWTIQLKPLITEDSYKNVKSNNLYKNLPDLRFAKFDEFDLVGAKFQHANLQKATFFRSDSSSIKLTNCFAADTKWNNSVLDDAVFDNCDLHHSNFSNTQLKRAVFKNCILTNAYFRNSVLTETTFINCDLRHSNLSEINLNKSNFDNVKLYGTSLWDLKYDTIYAKNIDLSKNGKGEIMTILEDDKLVEVINTLKSNTVVILGADSKDDSLSLLEKIGKKARSFGFTPIIVKNLREIDGESFTKKAIMYSLIAKFVIIENSNPSGHILEFNKVLDLGCIVGVLHKENTGSTWLLEENFLKYPYHLNKFTYSEDLDNQIDNTYKWCISQYEAIKNKLNELYKELNLVKI